MEPLSALSPSKQNARSNRHEGWSPQRHEISYESSPGKVSIMANAPISPPHSPDASNAQDSPQDTPSSPRPVSSHSQGFSPLKARSPVKYIFQDDGFTKSSPPGSPADSTVRFNDGLTRAIENMQNEVETTQRNAHDATMNIDEGMSTIYHSPARTDTGDDIDITLSLDNTINNDATIGDLSTISAIQTDMTRFANLRPSPIKASEPEAWSPSKQLRSSISFSTPAGNQPRPLLLGRKSGGSEDYDETPRRPRISNESPDDLMNFTGLTNIHIPPPPDSAPRTQRRSPSGRGAFPIRVQPTPSHRSQASMDRERAGGRSVQKPQLERSVPATPSNTTARHSLHGNFNGFGLDLLDIDLEPLATPRSIPTVTPRELETLRSELQSRISGLEATLSGKEAEVLALKRAITDAEVRAGKASEELRTERSEKEELQARNDDLERRSREMEEVLRELKQNAFVEEHEREKLRRQAEEADRRTEEHEIKILELNASLETLRSDRVRNSFSPHRFSEPATPGTMGTVDVDGAVKNATETVARELHALYKSKHERKVSDLKVSYEKRWIKQVEQARAELKEAQDQIVKMETEREATMSGALPNQLQSQSEQLSRMEGQIEELRRFNEETVAEKKMLEAEISGFKNQVDTIKQDNEALRREVECERTEKGELVSQVEVFLQVSAEQEKELERHREREVERERELQREKDALQREREAQRSAPVSPPRSDSDASSSTTTSAFVSSSVASPNKFRNSVNGGFGNAAGTAHSAIGRARPLSMLQKPTGGKFSGIPGPGASGLKAPKSGSGYLQAGRGGLMEGIARMGAGGR